MTQINQRNELIKKEEKYNRIINCYLVGPNVGNSEWIPVENADDYPPKHGVTYSIFTSKFDAQVTRFMRLAEPARP